MQTYQLKTSDSKKFNSKLHIPYAEPQVVEFDGEGNFEASFENDDELELLLNAIPDFRKAEEIEHEITEQDLKNNPDLVGQVEVGDKVTFTPIEPQTEDNELGKSEDEGNDIGKDKEEENDLTGEKKEEDKSEVSQDTLDMINSLDPLKVDVLRQLAIDSEYPKEQWEALKKPELLNYLKEKLLQA